VQEAALDLEARRSAEDLEALASIRRVLPDEAHHVARFADRTGNRTPHSHQCVASVRAGLSRLSVTSE
jgi:hypothetical protein